MSEVTSGDIAHLARLARLTVTPDEEAAFAQQLEALLDTVDQIGASVGSASTSPHFGSTVNDVRPDAIMPSLPRARVLAQAPDAAEDRFRVPRILGEEEG